MKNKYLTTEWIIVIIIIKFYKQMKQPILSYFDKIKKNWTWWENELHCTGR